MKWVERACRSHLHWLWCLFEVVSLPHAGMAKCSRYGSVQAVPAVLVALGLSRHNPSHKLVDNAAESLLDVPWTSLLPDPAQGAVVWFTSMCWSFPCSWRDANGFFWGSGECGGGSLGSQGGQKGLVCNGEWVLMLWLWALASL